MLKVKVTASGRISLPATLRERYGLARGVEVLVEDTGEAIILRMLDQAVAHAQAISRRLTEGKAGSIVDDFLAERAREADGDVP